MDLHKIDVTAGYRAALAMDRFTEAILRGRPGEEDARQRRERSERVLRLAEERRYWLAASEDLRAAPVEALNDLVREAGTPCKRDGCDRLAMPWSTFVARWGDHDLSCCSDGCREAVERQYEEYLREQSEERAAETRRDTALGG